MSKFFNIVIFSVIGLIFFGLVTSQCSRSRNQTVTVSNYAGDGLNLQAVTDLALKSKNAEAFEKDLNDTSKKINNLDLNEDEKVDYIKVTEINKGKTYGFSLTVDVEQGGKVEEQEVCTIQIEKDGSSHARVQTHGNRHIYGNNHYYHHRTGIGDVILWSYLFSNNRPYQSSYGYNNYPSHFNSNSKPMTQQAYSGFHQTQPYTSNIQKASTSQFATPIQSPNKNKVASNIKAPLKNPSTSQRSFQRSNPSKSMRTSSSVRYGSSSSSRSGSSFGGGK